MTPRHDLATLACVLLVSVLFPSCEAVRDGITNAINGGKPEAPIPQSPDKSKRVDRSIVDGKTRIELRDFNEVTAQQEEHVWCWAACAYMIARYNEVTDVSQKAIANRIHGFNEDGSDKVAAASRFEVFRALAPDAPQSEFEAVWQEFFQTQAAEAAESLAKDGKTGVGVREGQIVDGILERYVPSVNVPIAELAKGHPAVVGLREERDSNLGHVYVLIGATYAKKGFNLLDEGTKFVEATFDFDVAPAMKRVGFSDYDVSELVLIDPLVEDDESTEVNEMRRVMSFDEFKEVVDFVTTESDARTALTRWGKVAEVK